MLETIKTAVNRLLLSSTERFLLSYTVYPLTFNRKLHVRDKQM